MNLITKAKINFNSDIIWLRSNFIPFNERLQYIFTKYWAIIFNKRKINYLGKEFSYDGRFGPFILQSYPKEIMDIDNVIKLSNIKTILDIGTNVGQWSFTIKRFFPNVKIFSFEPNKKVFEVLESNRNHFIDNKWEIFNYAVGSKEEEKTFYFSPSATAEGSLYKENMSQNFVRKDINETKVSVIPLIKKNIKKLKIPAKFDFVKIDVEGAEMDVLKGLEDIKFKYLEIEVKNTRKVGVTIEEVIKHFENRKIKIKLLYQSLEDEASVGNAIFELG